MTTMTTVIKFDYCGTIKRTRQVPTNLESLMKLIFENFPELSTIPFTVAYKDEDNDVITLSNDEDLQEAYLQLKESDKKVLKFFVTALKEKKKGWKDEGAQRTSNAPVFTNPFAEESKEMVDISNKMANTKIVDEPQMTRPIIRSTITHEGVICDNCEMNPIVGIRYKCAICPNYDLCENCEAKNVHAEHTMIKIRVPGQAKRLHESQVIEMDIPRNAFPGIIDSLRSFCSSNINQGHYGYWGSHRRWGGLNEHFRKHCNAMKKMGVRIGENNRTPVIVTSSPGMVMETKWQLKNDSCIPWPNEVTISKKSGNIDFEPLLIQGGFKPGEIINLSIPILAPNEPGTYKLKLLLNAKEGYRIGKCLKVEIIVSNPNEPIIGLEEIFCKKAQELEKAGFGTFEDCYDALVAEKGDIEAAKARCSKHMKQ